MKWAPLDVLRQGVWGLDRLEINAVYVKIFLFVMQRYCMASDDLELSSNHMKLLLCFLKKKHNSPLYFHDMESTFFLAAYFSKKLLLCYKEQHEGECMMTQFNIFC